MADKTFTYSDVSAHSTKKDLYIVVHDKVYDSSSFVDEHPYSSHFPCFLTGAAQHSLPLLFARSLLPPPSPQAQPRTPTPPDPSSAPRYEKFIYISTYRCINV